MRRWEILIWLSAYRWRRCLPRRSEAENQACSRIIFNVCKRPVHYINATCTCTTRCLSLVFMQSTPASIAQGPFQLEFSASILRPLKTCRQKHSSFHKIFSRDFSAKIWKVILEFLIRLIKNSWIIFFIVAGRIASAIKNIYNMKLICDINFFG